MEAEVGIEPTHKAFAEPCLTTWLLRRPQERQFKSADGTGKFNLPADCGGKWAGQEAEASGTWCAREDSNLHPLRDQILSLERLPFRHSRGQSQNNARSLDRPQAGFIGFALSNAVNTVGCDPTPDVRVFLTAMTKQQQPFQSTDPRSAIFVARRGGCRFWGWGRRCIASRTCSDTEQCWCRAARTPTFPSDWS
jgi:hypothetical protein